MEEFFASPSTAWAVLGVVLLIAEIMTGTFFLLAFAGGCFLAASLAWTTDAGLSAQLTACALGSALTFAVIKKWRKSQSTTEYSPDTGNLIFVKEWDGQKMGTTEYRGVTWSVKCRDTDPLPGKHEIVEITNNLIEVKRLN